ncbi:MAG: GNAT family N-acetyltransferase [Candidatus Omnitrophota bacterium]
MYIRSYKKEDAQSVKNLITSIMSQEFSDEQKAYQYNDLDSIDQAYGSVTEKFLVAKEDSSVIGTVGIKEDTKSNALLRRLFVHPSHRERGIGSMLVDTALDFCKLSGYKYVNFRATSKMKAAIDLLCKKKGFIEKDRCFLDGIEIINLSYKIK